MSSPDETNLYRSPELRFAVALALAGAALLLALLAAIGSFTSFMMLDFREWRPSSSTLSGSALEAAFGSLQTPIAEQQPLRLTLRLPSSAAPGENLAAERELPARGRSCFRTLLWSEVVPPGTVPRPATAVVAVNGVVAATMSATGTGAGSAVWIGGIEPRDGAVTLRLELRADAVDPAGPGRAGAPAGGEPIVHFELATLRRCDASAGASMAGAQAP